jgi:rod shape-determining protein MreD
MKPLAHVFFALLLAALQAALLRWAGGGWFSLALLAACVVHHGLQSGNVDGSVASAGIGYVMDLMSGSTKGLMTALAVLLFLAIRATSAAVDVRSRSAFALLSGAGAFFLSLGAMTLTRYTAGADAAPALAVVPRMLLEAVLTGALAPFVGVALRRLDGLFQREETGLLR